MMHLLPLYFENNRSMIGGNNWQNLNHTIGKSIQPFHITNEYVNVFNNQCFIPLIILSNYTNILTCLLLLT